MLVAQHPGTTHQQGDGIAIADLPEHFKNLAAQQANADREAGARALGITVEEFDKLKQPKEEPPESTPQSRTANLPAGKGGMIVPPRPQEPPLGGSDGPEGAWGSNLIAAQAAEDMEAWKRSGFSRWPRRANPALDD